MTVFVKKKCVLQCYSANGIAVHLFVTQVYNIKYPVTYKHIMVVKVCYSKKESTHYFLFYVKRKFQFEKPSMFLFT